MRERERGRERELFTWPINNNNNKWKFLQDQLTTMDRLAALYFTMTLTHVCPEVLLTIKTLMQQSFPSLHSASGLLQKTNREKYSTASSLNKGSPSSEVHVSRMPKLPTAKTCRLTKPVARPEYGTVGINGLEPQEHSTTQKFETRMTASVLRQAPNT